MQERRIPVPAVAIRAVRTLAVIVGPATSVACAPRQPAPEPRASAHDNGSLVLIARGDTTVRDDYTRRDTLLRGTVQPLVRGAKFGWAYYEVRFDSSGEARRVTLSLGRVGTSPTSAAVSTFTTVLGTDFIVEEWPNKPATTTAYRLGAIPVFGPSIAMSQEITRRARQLISTGGTVDVPVYSLLDRSELSLARVRWLDESTMEVRYGDSPGTRYTVDRAGNILRGTTTNGEFVTVRIR
jgi:hypothetical protein